MLQAQLAQAMAKVLALHEQLAQLQNHTRQLMSEVKILREQLVCSQGEAAACELGQSTPPPEQGSEMLLPERFDGDHWRYPGFLNQCQLLFLLWP